MLLVFATRAKFTPNLPSLSRRSKRCDWVFSKASSDGRMPQVASTGLHGEHERQSKMLLRNLVDFEYAADRRALWRWASIAVALERSCSVTPKLAWLRKSQNIALGQLW